MSSFVSKFQEILKTPGFSLKQFFRTAAEDLFPEASYHPDVLKCSASNGNRFIKQFLNNPHGNLRIFYFQLLRLCYEPSLCHSLGFFNKLKRVVLNPDFNILFSFDTEEQSTLFNNIQFKKLFAEFLDHLDYEEQPCIENSINDYPIIDIVMIHILRSLLVTRNINPEFHCKIDTHTVFRELANIFKLKLSVFQDYWVFEDSDFIVHAESEWELYISYKERREVQDQIRRRKYINGLLLNKPSESQSTTESLQENKTLTRQKKTTPLQITNIPNITNIRSPKSSLKMTGINFGNNSFSSKYNLKQSAKPYYLKSSYELKKTNPECTKCQNCQTLERTMTKGTGSESLAFLGFRNKQNTLTRNISFDQKRQHRSRSTYKGQLISKGRLFKKLQ